MKTHTAKGMLGMRSRAAPSNRFIPKSTLDSSKAAIVLIDGIVQESFWWGFG
jgi:hypothetical protein